MAHKPTWHKRNLGQTFTLSHLAPFVDVSRQRIRKDVIAERTATGDSFDETAIEKVVKMRLADEIKRGIQTIQYQLITLMTCNGQAPFVTMFMYLDEVPAGQTRDDLATIIEEALYQRIQGVKNEKGVWVTTAFPKIIYVLDEDNIHEDSKYYYLTELAAKCTAKRMVPDYISAKVMKENKNGDVYPCMGCVDKDEVIQYKIGDTYYTESIGRAWNRMALFSPAKVQPGRTDDLYRDLSDVTIWDVNEKKFVPVKRIIRNKSKDWLELTFSNGRILNCTPDHPFETVNRGVVHAKDLTSEDIILADKKSEGIDGWKAISTDTAWALGLACCDGCYDGHLWVSLGKDEEDIGDAYADRIGKSFDVSIHSVPRERGKNGGSYIDYVATANGNTVSIVTATLKAMFEGTRKLDRHIPNEVFTWNREARLAFLAGMVDADGYINNNAVLARVQIGSTNKELALQEMLLAQSCGMHASIYRDHHKGRKHMDRIRYKVEFVPSNDLMKYIVSSKKREHMTCNTRQIGKTVALTTTCVLTNKIPYTNENAFSYDVTTESEHFTVSGLYSHNCRSFLTADNEANAEGLCNDGNKANAGNYEDGQHKYYGRFNQGVVTINLVDVACSAAGDMDAFWNILDERLELCHKALRCRHERLLGTTSDVAPILWQNGAYARLEKGEKIDKLLYGNYSTISLGYGGLYEMCVRMIGKSHTSDEGREFSLKVMQRLNDKCAEWRAAENISYSVYGSPMESTVYKFAKCLQRRFGMIKDVTDHNYITNSYHVNVREQINAFDKLGFEADFQKLSPGGAISYVEVPNMQDNIPGVLAIMKFIYENIMYAELNIKSDYCMECGYDGEIRIIEDEHKKLVWECPNCGNRDQTKMSVARRTCGRR